MTRWLSPVGEPAGRVPYRPLVDAIAVEQRLTAPLPARARLAAEVRAAEVRAA